MSVQRFDGRPTFSTLASPGVTPRVPRFVLTLLLSVTLGAASSTAVAADQSWSSTRSEVKYDLRHPFHDVTGVCTSVEAMAVANAEGLKVMARAAIKAFDSGNSNRDSHMLEVMDAVQHSTVIVKGVVAGWKLEDFSGKKSTAKMQAEIDLKGIKTTKDIDLTVDAQDPAHIVVSFEFEESLESHGVKRPSLMFVAVADALKISGNLTMEPIFSGK